MLILSKLSMETFDCYQVLMLKLLFNIPLH